ncbi:S46 family peptidase [Brumimicrobium salinarum]|uniref:Dipeptidyl-peptidase n=1 Tax=Brumimicrobium salinarum TaxID=2058658 RepID=A0A2I0R2Q2_9FLAO|nr:S46 family peptidase [Brumimicrobium salinarum]PKR80862.1 S46 family peptidase [Brumimicrobium salinarum]
MKKISALVLVLVFGLVSRAEEGMLIPTLLGAFESDMKAMGMKISAEDIYSVNNASIKDAIMHFGGGCTSEVVSDQGLLLTNHHCGFSQIYAHTSIDNNIAKHGYWAKTLEDELKNPGLTAARMVRIEDVTQKVLAGTSDLSGAEANQKIMTNIALIKSEALNGTHYEAEIKPFDYGNSYFLLVKETFLDVRLVGTPPKTVGKFGGDTDNWVWPRHTGDFAVFRIYANAENQPAEYNENNKPYTPIHHLPVSIKPREKDEFTMVFGFPGRTYQHTISTELDFIIDTMRPAQIKMRELSLSVINNAMRKSESTEIMYASKQARIANAWKKWKGQIDGLKRGNAIQKKVEYENAYTQAAANNDNFNRDYGTVVKDLRELSSRYNNADFTYNMFIEYAYVGPEIFKRARAIEELLTLCKEEKSEELEQEIQSQIESVSSFYSKYDVEIDREVFLLQSEFYKKTIENNYLPESLSNNNVSDLRDKIYKKSFLIDSTAYLKVLNNFEKYAKKKIHKDPGYQLYEELNTVFEEKVLNDLRTYYGLKNQLMKTYVKGKYEMYPEDKHWANANSTLRITYGKLEGSTPRDGMRYTPYTTLDGVIEKYNTGDEDFDLLPRMLKLYAEKNYGEYAQDDELWVCFTGSNHTTGGNSGSPVINGDGHLIGINFDRSWESTMSDYMFDASRCRNISVDIRFVLWMIDVYGEAPHIVEEMTLVR